LYGPGGSVRWSIYHVNPGYAGFALMHGTGTFAVYDSDGVNPIYVWDTQTNGHDGAYLLDEFVRFISAARVARETQSQARTHVLPVSHRVGQTRSINC
jgi:hypothetical protein